MHARVVLGVGKGVLFREVSSFEGVPIYRGSSTVLMYTLWMYSIQFSDRT